jgi:hypothetical protein
MSFPMQTGGAKRHWLFDPNMVSEIPQIRDKMIHYDDYDALPSQDKIITFVLDHLISTLPDEESEAVRLMHMEQLSMRAAGRELGIDHKTVGARASRGLAKVKARIKDTPWLSDFLQGSLPEDEQPQTYLQATEMFYSLFRQGGHHVKE